MGRREDECPLKCTYCMVMIGKIRFKPFIGYSTNAVVL